MTIVKNKRFIGKKLFVLRNAPKLKSIYYILDSAKEKFPCLLFICLYASSRDNVIPKTGKFLNLYFVPILSYYSKVHSKDKV
jgi:hypothetical protein